MATVIAVANQKGGCGKTTAAMNLAGGLAKAGYRVLVVDADPQESSLNWRSMSEDSRLPFQVIALASPMMHKELPGLIGNSDYELVLIDCPPGGAKRGDNITRSAILAADAVIMPVQPSLLDYMAAQTMLPMLSDVSLVRAVRVFLLINRKQTNNRVGREARQAAASAFQAEGVELRVLDTELANLTAFVEAPAAGQTVLDYAPESKAAEQVVALTQEVIECLSVSAVA